MSVLRSITLGAVATLGAVGCLAGGISEPGGGGGGGGGGDDTQPPGGTESDALISEWSGCMTIENFRLAKMNTAWGTLAASNGQACSSCHGTGFEGFYADRDEAAMYSAITKTKGFLTQYFIPDVPNHKMVVNEVVFKAVGTNQAPHQAHPSFTPTANAGMTALRAYYDTTLQAQQAHTCAPSRLTP